MVNLKLEMLIKDGGLNLLLLDIDSETGRISWNIRLFPNFEELFDNATDLVKLLKVFILKLKQMIN